MLMQTSPKDIQFFPMVSPNESPNIMGLKGVHSLEAYIGEAAAPSAPGVGRRGRNEGTSHEPLENHALSFGLSMCPLHGLLLD